MSNQYGGKGTLYNPGPGGGYALIFWVLRLALLCLLVAVIIRNIEPYSIWSMAWFGERQPAWIGWVPGASWLATAAYRFTGIVLWALLQTLETIPIFLLGTRFGLGTLIASYQQQAEQQSKIETYPTDDAVLVFLKRKYNGMGLKALDFFRMAAPFAYVIDFVLVWQIFPPLKEGYTWGQIVAGWNFGGVAWGNVVSIVVTVLAFEAVVVVWLRTSEMLFLIRRGIRSNA
jgi:hypothetical protein